MVQKRNLGKSEGGRKSWGGWSELLKCVGYEGNGLAGELGSFHHFQFRSWLVLDSAIKIIIELIIHNAL